MGSGSAVDEQIRTYTIDRAHSEIGFVVRHMGFSKVRGRFERFEGTVHVDPSQIASLEAAIDIDASSITTDDETRDDHLRTNDFLSVTEHPHVKFKSTGVKNVSAQVFTLEGNLTIRGVTKHVELNGTYLGEGKDPWGGTRVGFEGSTKINRRDFGVNWNAALETGGFLVGDQVEILLDIQAVQSEED